MIARRLGLWVKMSVACHVTEWMRRPHPRAANCNGVRAETLLGTPASPSLASGFA